MTFSKGFERISHSPRLRGAYFMEEAHAKGLALLEAKARDTKIFWLIEPETERITSAKYFTYGGPASIAVGETYSTTVIGMTVPQALRVGGKDIERALRDDMETPSGPIEVFEVVNELREAAKEAYPKAMALAEAAKISEKVQIYGKKYEKGVAGWSELSKEEQLQAVERALDGDIRDYLTSEGGGVEVVDIVNGTTVVLSFEGMCGSCSSSTGSTLFAIENALRQRVNEKLTVVNAQVP